MQNFNKIIQIDDVVDIKTQNNIEMLVKSPSTSWMYNEKNVVKSNCNDIFQFTHSVVKQNAVVSKLYSDIDCILKNALAISDLKLIAIERIKINLLPSMTFDVRNLPSSAHKDISDEKLGNYATVLYYINDSDGDTVFYTDENAVNISPKKGKCVVFNSRVLHHATPPSIGVRIIVNMVLKIE